MLVAAIAASALTFLLYSAALDMPLWADDLLQAPWVEATPLAQLWHSVGPYGDFRPLHFSLWRGLYLVGMLTPRMLHGLNLAGHALSSFLVGMLAVRIAGRSLPAALLGVSFFAAFPFAYDTVLWASSFSYPLTVILTLTALLLYFQARVSGNNRWHFPAILLTLLAGFAYEGGVIAGASIVWAELCLHKRPYARWSLVYLSASLLPFAAITRISPAVPTEFLTGLHPAYNFVIALQCLIYPLAALAEPLAQGSHISAITWLMLLGLLAIAGWLYLTHKARAYRIFYFSLGWAVMWSIIPLATQAFNWYRDPPRVFYLSAVGIALLWAAAIEQITPLHWPRKRRAAAQALLSLALLTPGAFFLHKEVALHRQVGALLWAAAQQAETQPGTLFINLPGRITLPERRYPLGHEGAIPLPPPANGELWLAVHSGGGAQAAARAQGAILPPTPYTLEMADAPLDGAALRTAQQIVQVRYQTSAMGLEYIGKVLSAQAPAAANAAAFSNANGQIIFLRQAQCRWSGPDSLTLDLVWQTFDTLDGTPTIFTHWLGADGALVAQADGAALRGLYPPAQWLPRELIHETRRIEPAPRVNGMVALGIWDPAANTRWTGVDSAGDSLLEQSLRLEHCTE